MQGENRQQKAANFEGAGGGNVAVGTDGGKPIAHSPSCVILPENGENVNPFSGPIPTAAGGPVAWAVADSLFTLKAELEALGLTCPDEAIYRAWAKMVQEATYIPKRQRRAVLKAVGA